MKRRRYKRAKRWLVFQIARAFLASIALFGESFARLIGRAIGAAAHTLATKVRERSVEQMQAALQIDEAEAREKTRALFKNLGLTIAEMALLRRDERRALEWVVDDPQPFETLKNALQKGRGVIAISAHLGNWELLAQHFAQRGLPVVTAARENPNPYLDRWIVDLRAQSTIITLHRGQQSSGLQVLRTLRRGSVFALLIDQDTKVRSVFVPFFGRPASTPVAPAELAIKVNAPVVFSYIVREGEKHRVVLEEVDTNGLEDATALTALLTKKIEEAVKKYPEQWVWFHERWKRQP